MIFSNFQHGKMFDDGKRDIYRLATDKHYYGRCVSGAFIIDTRSWRFIGFRANRAVECESDKQYKHRDLGTFLEPRVFLSGCGGKHFKAGVSAAMCPHSFVHYSGEYTDQFLYSELR